MMPPRDICSRSINIVVGTRVARSCLVGKKRSAHSLLRTVPTRVSVLGTCADEKLMTDRVDREGAQLCATEGHAPVVLLRSW
jgi:hypothetical protein